jgi:hypothetical protein
MFHPTKCTGDVTIAPMTYSTKKALQSRKKYCASFDDYPNFQKWCLLSLKFVDKEPLPSLCPELLIDWQRECRQRVAVLNITASEKRQTYVYTGTYDSDGGCIEKKELQTIFQN